MQHLDEGTIHAWLDGALPGAEAAAVAEHVARCRECAALVAEARGMIAAAGNIVSALDAVRGGVIPIPAAASRGQRSLWRRLRFTPARAALAATLLIAVASLLSVRRDKGRNVTDSAARVTAEATPSAAPPPPTASVATPASVATSSHDSGARMTKVATNAPVAKPVKTMANAPRRPVDSTANAAADQVFSRGVAAAGSSAAASSGQPAVAPPAAKAAADLQSSALDRRARVAPQVQEAVAGGVARPSLKSFAVNSELEGCYQVRSDSGAMATALGVPARFALLNVSGGVPRAVGAVSPDGRIDSLVPGGTWQRLAPDMIQVSFANARQPSPLTLQVDAAALGGRAGAVNQVASLPVTRIECRR